MLNGEWAGHGGQIARSIVIWIALPLALGMARTLGRDVELSDTGRLPSGLTCSTPLAAGRGQSLGQVDHRRAPVVGRSEDTALVRPLTRLADAMRQPRWPVWKTQIPLDYWRFR